MAKGTVITITKKSIINAQNAFSNEYKRGTAVKHDLLYISMEHVTLIDSDLDYHVEPPLKWTTYIADDYARS